MAGITRTIYDALFRRNQTFLGLVFVSAFGLEVALDTSANGIWDYINRGRQWKDIKAKYVQGGDDDE